MLMLNLILVVLMVVVSGDVLKSDEDDIDSVMELLMNGDSVEIVPSIEENTEEQPVFSDGIWKCGRCSNMDKTKLIYTEVNEVDTNVSEERGFLQVGLSLDNMSCITVSAGQSSIVRRVSGTCAGEQVTLAVSAAKHFTVNVYGY